MAITRKIGERFEYKGKTFEVRECANWYTCHGCAFGNNGHPSLSCYENNAAMLEITGECSGAVSTDGKYVCFVKVRHS